MPLVGLCVAVVSAIVSATWTLRRRSAEPLLQKCVLKAPARRCQAELREPALNQTHPSGGGWPRPLDSFLARPAVVPLFPWRWRRVATARRGKGMMYWGGRAWGRGQHRREGTRERGSEEWGRWQLESNATRRRRASPNNRRQKETHTFLLLLARGGETHCSGSVQRAPSHRHTTRSWRRNNGDEIGAIKDC